MTDIKPIRTRADYDRALVLLHELLDQDPAANSPEDAKIQVLAALIEEYENLILPDYQVDPIEAIKLRIEQLGLKDIDLVPFLGSRSRVSEVLSGKRALTVAMVRNLEEGLGIPASVLVGSGRPNKNNRWSASTLSLMAQRGYFGEEHKNTEPRKITDLGLLRSFFSSQPLISAALLRQSNYRDISKVDKYLMEAWASRVLQQAFQIRDDHKVSSYDKAKISLESLIDIFHLSVASDGIIQVIGALEQLGIIIVIEPPLPNTRLDGATFFTEHNPVIGITIRFDRLDSFWFTLAHELSHVYLHSDSQYGSFYDQLFESADDLIAIESEADKLAGELLIPTDKWKTSPLRFASTPTLVKTFAHKIGVHESIVAGRIRYDSKDWTVHSDLVHEQKPREFFEGKIW